MSNEFEPDTDTENDPVEPEVIPYDDGFMDDDEPPVDPWED